jgi:hypothetical protein
MIKLLYYHALDTKGVKKQVEKVESALMKGDFGSAEVKKMVGTDGLYRAKLNRSDRLLFKFAQYRGETHLLLLEVIRAHDYDHSKFLQGAEIDEAKFEQLPSMEAVEKAEQDQLVYVNPKQNRFHLLDKFISFDDAQEEIYGLPAPLIIIGSAGSGKTALTLEKMKHFQGQVAYVSLSPYLVENAQRIYYANGYDNEHQEIEFISFEEYLQGIDVPSGREVTFRDFEGFYSRFQQTFKFKEPYKLFEEFKGVLTGSVIDRPHLTREDYLGLGVKQSIFLKEERGKVYDLFERYLAFLAESNLYDSNMVAQTYLDRVQPRYDFVVVDEVQDITNVQLVLILRSLITPTRFLLSGDSNQIVHPNFFSWSKVKSLFFTEEIKGSAIRILKTNYRNAQLITQLSNDLLKIKNARFGSIDKESTYLINTVSSQVGEVNFFKDDDKIKKELNQRTRNSAKYAVLVMDREDKQRVKKHFDTPLVFTIQEAKGLEYENIILVNFVSDHEKEFREITKGVSKEDLADEKLQYGRSKDKENKELEAYKFYINSLYVAFTRAVKNLFLIESNAKQDLLALLGVVKQQEKVQVKQQQSTDEEWLEEARRLEKQGKAEQAQEIRDRIKGVVYISPEEAEALQARIWGNPEPNAKDCERLFTYATNRNRIDLVARLSQEAHFGPAKQYHSEYRKAQSELTKHIRNGNQRQVERYTSRFGIDIPEPESGRTGLMLAVFYGKQSLIDFFMAHEANVNATAHNGQNVLQMVLLAYELEHIDEPELKHWYLRFAPQAIKVRSNNQVRKVSRRSMEFFLVNYVMAVRDELIAPNDPPSLKGLRMDDFMEYIELMPEAILPAYRRKRQYVNSILAKNEVDRDDQYNRHLFRRKSRGCYNLYEDLSLLESE